MRKILYIGIDGLARKRQLREIFPHAELRSLAEDAQEIEHNFQAIRYFDLIICMNVRFSGLSRLLELFKVNVILSIGSDLASCNLENDFDRLEDSNLTIYRSRKKLADMFIPIGPDDIEIANSSIANKYKKLTNIREIFYCSKALLDVQAPWVSERAFEFDIEDVKSVLRFYEPRANWYYQQLLQFYAFKAEPSLLDSYVAIACDVFFNEDLDFFLDNIPIFTLGRTKAHTPYLEHMARLNPLLTNQRNISAVSYYVPFNRKTVLELIADIEAIHGEPFWKVFLREVKPDQLRHAGAAEVEIYYAYVQLKQTEHKVRNVSHIDVSTMEDGENSSAVYFAYHWHSRKT